MVHMYDGSSTPIVRVIHFLIRLQFQYFRETIKTFTYFITFSRIIRIYQELNVSNKMISQINFIT